MGETLRRRLWRWAVLASWVGLGAVIIAAFFVASFFQVFSPLPLGDPGAALLIVPLLTGLLLGILLTDEEIVVAAGAGVLSATLAVVLVAAFLFSPILAGVAQATQPFTAFSITQIAISTIVLFPFVVVGSVLGRGLGDLFLPSVRFREQLRRLREDTRLWHEALERMERRDEEPPEERKD